jgi:L-ribulose-5-phosphate 3-epimerase
MKIGVFHSAISTAKSWEEKFAIARDAGYDGIELGTIEGDEELRQVKKAADDVGIEISSIMDTLHWKCPLSSPDNEVRTKGMDHIKRSLECAAYLDADTVLVVPGVVTPEVSYKDAYERSFDAICQLGQVAQEMEIYLGIENVWNKFLVSPLEFNDFIEKTGNPYVAAYFDVGNIILYGYPQHWIEVLGSKIKKVHAKNFLSRTYTFTHLLYGDVNWKAVMDALRKVGYNDFITAELPSYHTCPEQMVYDTAKHLRRIIDL